jgi:hypothetical protein
MNVVAGSGVALTVLIGAANAAEPACSMYSAFKRLPSRFIEVAGGELSAKAGSGKPGSVEFFALTDGTCTCENEPWVDRHFGKSVPAGVYWSCHVATGDERKAVQ